jgi:hypothetical protein
MNASAHFLSAESDDHPLDLPPVAETDDIASVAAVLGANGGFEPRIVAEPLDEFGGIGKGRPPGDE